MRYLGIFLAILALAPFALADDGAPEGECRYCGATRRDETWSPPAPSSRTAAVPSQAKGSFTLRGTGLLLLVSAVHQAFTLTSEVPLFGDLRGGGVGDQAVQRGDAEAAESRYDALVSRRGTVLAVSQRGVAVAGGMVGADRLLGLLAHTIGKLDDASAHFEEALAFCCKAGYRPELAWSCSDYADMLRERDAEGDRAKAVSLLDESLAISSELGMRTLMERVLARREILKA